MTGVADIYPQFVQVGLELGAYTTRGCLVLAPTLAFGLLVYSIARSVMQRDNSLADFSPLLEGLLLVYVLMSYKELTWLVSAVVSTLCQTVPLSPGIGEVYHQMSQFAPPDVQNDLSLWEKVNANVSYMFSFRRIAIGIIADGALSIVRLLVDFLRGAIVTFMYVVGPIAITLSLLPWFRETAKYWLQGFIGIQLWSLTLRVVDRIAYSFNINAMRSLSDSGFDNSLENGGDDMIMIAGNLLFIFMYIVTPSITSYFFSPSAIGSALGNRITYSHRLRRILKLR